MTLWIISDTHFGHANILDYEPRRRAWCDGTIEGHDRAIIEAWRAVVQPDDDVLHCGDFALGHRERVAEILAQLPGRKYLVLGNHDRGPSAMESLGFFVAEKSRSWELTLGRWIHVRHAPSSFTGDECANGTVLLHGHMHGHVPGINDAPRDRRHAYPTDPAVRAKLIDASIEALPTAPGPMRLRDLLVSRGFA